MRRYIISLGITFSVISGLPFALLGCNSQTDQAAVPSSPIASSTTATSPHPMAQADLQTYADPAMPIATQYPSNMMVEDTCSGEGCGFFFRFQPQGNALDQSEVHIFLAAGSRSATEAEQSANSLIDNNGWKTTPDVKPPAGLMYPWVKKAISFSAESGMVGQILIGETNGQGVRATLLYPSEMSDTFLPAAKTILDNLQFKVDKLPITTQG